MNHLITVAYEGTKVFSQTFNCLESFHIQYASSISKLRIQEGQINESDIIVYVNMLQTPFNEIDQNLFNPNFALAKWQIANNISATCQLQGQCYAAPIVNADLSTININKAEATIELPF